MKRDLQGQILPSPNGGANPSFNLFDRWSSRFCVNFPLKGKFHLTKQSTLFVNSPHCWVVVLDHCRVEMGAFPYNVQKH